MKRVYKILRAVLMTVIVLGVLLPAAIYVVLSSGWFSKEFCSIAEKELSATLGTQVQVGNIRFYPFDKVVVRDVVIDDDYGLPAVVAKRLETRFEIWHLLFKRHIVFDYALIDGAEINIYKKTETSPLNIANIISRISKKEPSKEPAHFDLSIYTIRLRNSQLNYDIADRPLADDRFDFSHIHLTGVDLLATAPKIESDEISGKIRHFRFDTNSGFDIKSFSGRFKYTPDCLKISELVLELPESYIALGNYDIALSEQKVLPLHILKGSYLTLKDLSAFVPKFATLEEKLRLEGEFLASEKEVSISNFSAITADEDFNLNFSGAVKDFNKTETLNLNDVALTLSTNKEFIKSTIDALSLTSLKDKFAAIPEKIELELKANGGLDSMAADINLVTSSGSIKAVIESEQTDKERNLAGNITLSDISIVGLENIPEIRKANARIKTNLILNGKNLLDGNVVISGANAEIDNHAITETVADLTYQRDKEFAGKINAIVDGANLASHFKGNANKNKNLAGFVTIDHFSPKRANLTDKYENYELSLRADVDLAENESGKPDGFVKIKDVNFVSPVKGSPQLNMKSLSIDIDSSSRPNEIEISGDYINGRVYGDINPESLVKEIKQMIANIMPELFGVEQRRAVKNEHDKNIRNNFNFSFTLDNVHQITDFFKLPVAVIYPVEIEGSMNTDQGRLTLGIDAPYLMKGDKIIEQTSIEALLKGDGEGTVYVTTQMPTPKGMLGVAAAVKAANDVVSTEVDWEIERDKHLDGKVKFDTRFMRQPLTDELNIIAKFTPSHLRFGTDHWSISPATIIYRPGYLAVENFALATQTQSIKIDGKCDSSHPNERIKLSLDRLVLNRIFETLDINKVLVGGRATGDIFIQGLFGDDLAMYSNEIKVENIGYNYCTLGTGFLHAKWDNAKKGVHLDLSVLQDDDRTSYVDATIIPATEELDVNITADNIKAGFMKPFMDGFATDVEGKVSGKVKVFGTFSNVDLMGDIYTEDFGLKVKFTNTWYYAKGAVSLTPGKLTIVDIPVRDPEGNTALLNGYFKHRYFSDLEFGFNITEARDILALDVAPRKDPRWFGKVYGSGSVFIKGTPTEVDIDVNMKSSPLSTFTYSLASTMEATQYSFIRFRDKTPQNQVDTIMRQEVLPEAVIAYRDKVLQEKMQQKPNLIYNIAIQADITPAAKITIIMDPDDGDHIDAWGHGNLRITYTSIGEELKMYGTYSIDHGDYGFTMQDIIVKDFTINEGSSITFTGNPNRATLDLKASYTVRGANLTDLDKSFKDDPELSRTNVPVNAVLLVKGDIGHPDLDFDLEFPTLTSDIYRKVRAIVSTEEMMNQQIIYLLALNRFYTPEYMSATRGNELFSVASSTITSRISSMLGRLSENWSISPNIRSDRGDFSDVQLDVALSSNLLNNRLRLNGNFGYRDKSLNTTQFIGDFDLEYLINPAGTWRLKAYNRFNDQTYFLRTAKTTQGVGIMYQRDFDNILGIFRRNKKKIEPTSETTSTEEGAKEIENDDN